MPVVQKVTVGTTQAINVRVNTAPSKRVNNIQYIPATSFSLKEAEDYQFENSENNISVLTYDATTDKFVVQNVPRLNGGTF